MDGAQFEKIIEHHPNIYIFEKNRMGSHQNICECLLDNYLMITDFYAKLNVLLDTIHPIDTPIDDFDTLLTRAIAIENKEMVTYLLKKGANINQKNPSGEHPLLQVISNVNYDIWEQNMGDCEKRKSMFLYLLQNGSSLLNLNKEQEHILSLIEKYRLYSLLIVLKEHVPYFDENQTKEWKTIRLFEPFIRKNLEKNKEAYH